MYQTPTPIWNQIAESQELATPLWEELFAAKDLPTALAPLEAKLEALGADARVTRAYLLAAPLLYENLAISRFVQETGRTDLRSSMPELTTVGEATILASTEFSLTSSQQKTLRRLLSMERLTQESASSSAPPSA